MPSISFSSSSYFSFSSSINGKTKSTRRAEKRYTDPSGHTVVQSLRQNLGEAPIAIERHFDAQGREIRRVESNATRRAGRIEDVDRTGNNVDVPEVEEAE